VQLGISPSLTGNLQQHDYHCHASSHLTKIYLMRPHDTLQFDCNNPVLEGHQISSGQSAANTASDASASTSNGGAGVKPVQHTLLWWVADMHRCLTVLCSAPPGTRMPCDIVSYAQQWASLAAAIQHIVINHRCASKSAWETQIVNVAQLMQR
jgi:hypothetical protein